MVWRIMQIEKRCLYRPRPKHKFSYHKKAKSNNCFIIHLKYFEIKVFLRYYSSYSVVGRVLFPLWSLIYCGIQAAYVVMEKKVVQQTTNSAISINSYFEEGCQKNCARYNHERQYGIWSIRCSWQSSCRTYFCCFPLAFAKYVHGLPCHSFKFLWGTVNSKPPTIPFGIVACTFSDDLSRNSCTRTVHCLGSISFALSVLARAHFPTRR